MQFLDNFLDDDPFGTGIVNQPGPTTGRQPTRVYNASGQAIVGGGQLLPTSGRFPGGQQQHNNGGRAVPDFQGENFRDLSDVSNAESFYSTQSGQERAKAQKAGIGARGNFKISIS